MVPQHGSTSMTYDWDSDWHAMADPESARADQESARADEEAALAGFGVGVAPHMTVTTKIPPAYDGRTSWFSYEQAIDDWCDITELPAAKQAPALRNRLEGEAAIYKDLLNREMLRDPNNGVKYFKEQMRPHFVKGRQSVFLW